ncbi:helix-turn-helix transcriptional regulator [Geomicrobium sp. JCM 19055]|uniref:helix-turn-helix transcriptional regulator n=1 Tax=Geomicrobium sp. JCM 19055 TaxID=1460649 RepID=UPI00045ECDFF|nr:AraC family transcriptional regulator [Geomicrobium sp. JCM 19055]GAJ97800.1 transcriptional regulator, AraC family [Geomicrobium sp. JCM 19055]
MDLIINTIDYIEAHLSEKLNLDRVAQALHYSKYHLHRVFSQTVGMTIHDYVQRRQLTEAAKQLVSSNKSILEIALVAGYDSQQAFTTIFKALYKKSPLQFRIERNYYPLQLRFQFDSGSIPIGKYKELATERIIKVATKDDIQSWMAFVRIVIDGFPYLHEDEHRKVLQTFIIDQRAFIMMEGGLIIGNLLISGTSGRINFLGVHPFYTKREIMELMIKMTDLANHQEIRITSFRKVIKQILVTEKR